MVHRRCRPEVFGGLIHVQEIGNAGHRRKDFEISPIVTGSLGARTVQEQCGSFLLPMAFSAGSPNHPAYGAGHATVAGACATVLKAWFKDDVSLADIIANAPSKEPGIARTLLQTGPKTGNDTYDPPVPYAGSDKLTVGGELNKLASNVAMGRSMGGVHWRSDNTRSLRLGEKIAAHILRKRVYEYAEGPASFSFKSFDGDQVVID